MKYHAQNSNRKIERENKKLVYIKKIASTLSSKRVAGERKERTLQKIKRIVGDTQKKQQEENRLFFFFKRAN